MVQAFESIVKSSHLNVTKNIANTAGSQMSMQSSTFARLGMCSVFYEFAKRSSHAESMTRCKLSSLAIRRALSSMLHRSVSCGRRCALYLQKRTNGRSAYLLTDVVAKNFGQLAQRGRYEDSLTRMQEVDEEAMRTLRHFQYWAFNLGIIKLRRHLHRFVSQNCKTFNLMYF